MTVFYQYIQAPRYVHIVRVVDAIVGTNLLKTEAGPFVASRNYFPYCRGEFLPRGTESHPAVCSKVMALAWSVAKTLTMPCSRAALLRKVRGCCTKASFLSFLEGKPSKLEFNSMGLSWEYHEQMLKR